MTSAERWVGVSATWVFLHLMAFENLSYAMIPSVLPVLVFCSSFVVGVFWTEFSLQYQSGPFHILLHRMQSGNKERQQLFGKWVVFGCHRVSCGTSYLGDNSPIECRSWPLAWCWLVCGILYQNDWWCDWRASPRLTSAKDGRSDFRNIRDCTTTRLIHRAISTLGNAYTDSTTVAEICCNTSPHFWTARDTGDCSSDWVLPTNVALKPHFDLWSITRANFVAFRSPIINRRQCFVCSSGYRLVVSNYELAVHQGSALHLL